MAPCDVWLQIEGYNERRKQDWELHRMTWFYIHAHSMAESKHKKKSPQQLHPFGWEGKTVSTVKGSPKEILEAHRKLKRERQPHAGK